MWYVLRAYNSTPLYGYTDDPAIAEAYCDQLNRNREINVFSLYKVMDAELLAELNKGAHAVFTQDTNLDEINGEA
jgi:hypothetical protein